MQGGAAGTRCRWSSWEPTPTEVNGLKSYESSAPLHLLTPYHVHHLNDRSSDACEMKRSSASLRPTKLDRRRENWPRSSVSIGSPSASTWSAGASVVACDRSTQLSKPKRSSSTRPDSPSAISASASVSTGAQSGGCYEKPACSCVTPTGGTDEVSNGCHVVT